MELIIDIPEEQYNDIVKHLTDNDGNYAYSDFNLREIIRNGTPLHINVPSANCISRGVLDEIRQLYKDYQPNLATEVIEFGDALENLIDNAQAVPLPNEQIAWEQGYEAGLAQGKQDRPQGELKKLYGDKYYCSKCGKDCEQLYKRFCGYCGAELQ